MASENVEETERTQMKTLEKIKGRNQMVLRHNTQMNQMASLGAKVSHLNSTQKGETTLRENSPEDQATHNRQSSG
jgi:hypothetical protein